MKGLTRKLGMGSVKLSGYVPGAIGRIAELHGRYYYEHWGFNLFFESKVATELSEFLLRFNQVRDGFWVASVEEKIVGSIAIDGMNFNRLASEMVHCGAGEPGSRYWGDID